MVKDLIAVGLGGALGAMARYLVGQLAQRLLGTGFPWGTLAANISGCFLIGLALRPASNRRGLNPKAFSYCRSAGRIYHILGLWL